MNSNLESADDAGKFFTTQATARILENVGFSSANHSCINILSDLMKKYFDLLCHDVKSVAEHASRSTVNISDLNQTFTNKNIKMQEVHDYIKQVQSFSSQIPVPLFPVKKLDHDIRGSISKRELVQRLDEEFPMFLPAMHRDWVEEEQPRPRPSTSTAKPSSEQLPSTSQQIEIKIDNSALRESSQESTKAFFRRGNKIRPTTFPTFLGKTIHQLGFLTLRPPPPPIQKRLTPSPQPVVEEKVDVRVEEVPIIDAPVKMVVKNDVIIDVKHLPQPPHLHMEKQIKEHKKEKSKKKKKDKIRDREKPDKKREKHIKDERHAGQESMVSSSTGPKYAVPDTTTIFSTVPDGRLPEADIPSTSEQAQPLPTWPSADSSADLGASILGHTPFILPENEDSNTQPFVEGKPLASTNETLPTTFPSGLTMENDMEGMDGYPNLQVTTPKMEEILPSLPNTNESINLPSIPSDVPIVEPLFIKESPPKDRKKKERRSHEEKKQRRKEKEEKRRKKMETGVAHEIKPMIHIKNFESFEKSIENFKEEPSIKLPTRSMTPEIEQKFIREPIETPPVVVELEKFEYPKFSQPLKEKDKEKKKKKDRTDVERKKKKEDRKRKHQDDGDNSHKKKKRKHEHNEPFISEEPKVPKLTIKFKPIGPPKTTTTISSHHQQKSTELQQVVAPLKILRPQPIVPSSEQVQAQPQTSEALKPEVKKETPEKPSDPTKSSSLKFFGVETPDLSMPTIKFPMSTLKRTSSEEKIEAPREDSPTITNEKVVENTTPPPKLKSETKKKEKHKILPKLNPPPMDMNKVIERPSAVGLPPSASIKMATKNGKSRADKNPAFIKKKAHKIIKQNTTDKGIKSVEKPKKEKKNPLKIDKNFLFSETIKPKKSPIPPSGGADEEEDDRVWICPVCSVAYVEGADMVACDGCDNWFHWICVGLMSAPPETESWFCPTCARKRKKDQEKKKEKPSLALLSKVVGKEKKKKV